MCFLKRKQHLRGLQDELRMIMQVFGAAGALEQERRVEWTRLEAWSGSSS